MSQNTNFTPNQCPDCHSKENLENQRLCEKCERYVNQDHIAQRELQVDNRFLEKFEADFYGVPVNPIWSSSNLEEEDRKFEKLLSKARLSPQQKEVARLHFVNGLSFLEISKNLEIAKGSVQEQIERAIKKLNFCLTNVRTVGEEDKSTKVVDPHDYYSICPKCNHWDFQPKQDGATCLECGWTFKVQVESTN